MTYGVAKFGVVALAVISLQGCALMKSNSDDTIVSPTESAEKAAEGLPLTVLSDSQANAGAHAPVLAKGAGNSQVEGAAPTVVEVSSLDRSDLKSYPKISIHLAYAELSLSSGAGFRKGKLKIEKLSGDADCKIRVIESDKGLEISEPLGKHGAALSAVLKVRSALPIVSKCRFSIELGLKKAVDTNIELIRGMVSAESWDEPLHVKLDWGEIDVGTVGSLTVVCGRCTLTGDGIEGPLHYSLETGNVGMAGLSGTVEGRTLGDTVLKWRKLHSDSTVKLVSRAGDVILFFPESVPLAIDLKAPHGEVNSRFQTGAHGVPVSVSAELGNVQVYRATKEAKSVE